MNEWIWRYEGWDPAEEGQREALCTLGNGYLATRGALPESEADAVHYPGTYLAGVYNRLTTEIAGREVVNESLVNMPNWLSLRVRVSGGEWFRAETCEVGEHVLELDVHRGVLTRRSTLTDPEGRTLGITQRRFVSLRDPHLAALETTLVPLDFSGSLEVESAIDGTVRNSGVARYAELDDDHLEHVAAGDEDHDTCWLEVSTNDSHVRVSTAARTRAVMGGRPVPAERVLVERERHVAQRFTQELATGSELIVEKVVCVHTSRDPGIYTPLTACLEELRCAGEFETLLARHLTTWAHAWNRSHIDLRGDVGHISRVLHLHLFHLLQTVSKNTTEVDAGVPARGLHGEAYRGHIFWDEMFILPFLTFRVPEISRALLRYRARRLDRARQAAAEAGFAGAMYPWQSGSDGREETQILHLNPRSGHWRPDASHLQRHINAAVAYNVWQYWQVTTDLEFMRFWGAEMMLEIARFWASATTYHHALDRYEIRGVMGPDEYHEGYPEATKPGLDNNAYTNVMAVWCLRRALDALEILPVPRRDEIVDKLHITRDELDQWEDIATKMRLCFHGDGILSQFEGWDDLLELDWQDYRTRYGDIGRLDRILETEGDSPNRYKLSKQADTLMLLYLFSEDELRDLIEGLGYPFGDDFSQRHLAYYEPRTSHGSTLSQMVHAWLHSRVDRNRSWDLFRSALSADINDVQRGTTAEGIHLGAMAGTVDLVQRCYGGIETREDVLIIDPCLPEEVHELSFPLLYRRQQIQVAITQRQVEVRLTDDGQGHPVPVALEVAGTFSILEPGGSLVVPLR